MNEPLNRDLGTHFDQERRARHALLLGRVAALPLLALALACEPAHNFISPTVAQGPPPFVGPPVNEELFVAPTLAKVPVAAPTTNRPTATPLAFHKTTDSDDWVTHSFVVQPKYKRVILVGTKSPAPSTITVPRLALNPGAAPAGTSELVVDASVATLQDAADLAQGGDLVAVSPGVYQGFTLGDKADAGDNAYVRFVALGAPGEVIIDRATASDHNWMVVLGGAHHVIFEGFNVAGASAAGKNASGPNAGIFITGDFAKTSKLAHHLAIVRNFSHEHRKWGLHSVESHTVLLQDNVFSGSGTEHGAYVSDGSDDYVIRRNVFMQNAASGLQCNVDPLASLEKLRDHPSLQDLPPYKQTRGWALAAITAATERFGMNQFPDGRGFNFLIEDNVLSGNGRVGGAALNLAGVRESLVQNNLIYGNASSGIVQWDNGNPFDAAYVSPGPRSPADIVGPESLPMFGCFSNVIRNNTVVMNVRSRPALLIGSGSWGSRVRNNVLVNEHLSSIEMHATGIWRMDAAGNVINNVSYEGAAQALKSLAISLPDQNAPFTGMNRSRLLVHILAPNDEPWIVFEKGWWKANPRRPDYRPRIGSPLFNGTGDPKDMPKNDLNGKKRQDADIGAFAATN